MDERVIGLGLGIFWSLFLEESEKVLLSLTWRRASFQCASLWEGPVVGGGTCLHSPLLSGLPIHCIWLLLALSDPIMPK